MTPHAVAVVAQGFAHCEKPERYIQQVVSHWSHKMATSYNEGVGTFPFSNLESAVMTAQPGGIAITLTTAEQERNVRRLYLGYLLALSRGDLGVSSAFNEPVAALLLEQMQAP